MGKKGARRKLEGEDAARQRVNYFAVTRQRLAPNIERGWTCEREQSFEYK